MKHNNTIIVNKNNRRGTPVGAAVGKTTRPQQLTKAQGKAYQAQKQQDTSRCSS